MPTEKPPTHAIWKEFSHQTTGQIDFKSQCDKMVPGDLPVLRAFDFLALYQQDTHDLDRPLCPACATVLMGNRGSNPDP